MGTAVKRAFHRVLNVLRWRRIERDLADEVAFHMAMAEEQYRAQGDSPATARRRALRDFGGERWLEVSRSTRGVPLVQDLARDFRHAVRGMRRSPGFSSAIVIVVALGVGASTAVFSVVRGVLLAPLPYGNAESLFVLLEADSADGMRPLSYPTFEETAAVAAGVGGLAYVRGDLLLARHADGTMNLVTAFVSPEFFDVMAAAPRAGRTFGQGESTVAVLSARLAERLYGEARGALGRTLVAVERSYTVIGVMPPGFSYPAWADLWVPLDGLPQEAAFALTQRDLHVDSEAVLRLHPGISLERARTVLSAPIAHASAAFPEPGGRFDRASLTPLRDRVVGDAAPRLTLLFGAVVLVLLITCVNVAGLLLARGLARRSELSARLALGAGRGRLVRQLLTENVVLAVAGGSVGVLLAWLASSALRHAAAPLLPRMEEVGVDGRVLLFGLAVTLGSALLFGVVPALRATSGAQAAALRGSGRGAIGDVATARLRAGLVVVQIAVAVVLLVGATLLVRTAIELGDVDLGFEPRGVIVLRVFPPQQYGTDDARLELYRRLQQSLAAVPGVEQSELANHVPLTNAAMVTAVRTERTLAPDENALAFSRVVSAGYLDALRAQAVRGRLPTADDRRGPGIVVNQTLARREWGDADPIGRPITVFRSAQGAEGFGEPLASHVVGVLADIRERGPDVDPVPTVYVPLERDVWPNINLVVRTSRDPAALIPALRAAVSDVDADIPVAGPSFIHEFRPLTDYGERLSGTRALITMLLGGFALLAVGLALVGLSAVMAFLVAQRTRELGVRMALGATPADAARLVLRHSITLILLGIAAGVAAAVPAMRLIESQLFGVPPHDPVSYAAAIAVFVFTGAVASLVPARRAATVEPAVVLRL